MLNAAIYEFKSPLEPSERISFESNKDGLRFRETLKRLANQYGYNFIMKNVHTERSSTPAANAGDPPTIAYGGAINLLESYTSDNVSFCKKRASIIWGDEPWTEQANQEIQELSVT